MIHIISGGIDSGKTRKVLSLYNELKRGDGFVSRKVFLNPQEFTGYEIRRLSTGETLPLAFKEAHLPPGWDEIYRIGPFRFSRKAFDFADAVITEIIANHIEPVFIDEIGPLELSGKGFSPLVHRVLKAGKEVYLVVRTHCVADVLEKFNIEDYKPIIV